MIIHVLRANAASCALFGTLFAFTAPTVANIVGDPPILLLQVLGVGLLLNAALLFWTSTKPHPDRFSVLSFALGDALWVAATLALIGSGLWITTPTGLVLSIGVAAFVGVCGVLQWKIAPGHI
jgi:hypothetical protein